MRVGLDNVGWIGVKEERKKEVTAEAAKTSSSTFPFLSYHFPSLSFPRMDRRLDYFD